MELEESDSFLKSDKFTNALPDDLDPDLYECEMGINSHINVTGRLKDRIDFWRSTGASQFILDVIQQGYRIPFHSKPPSSFAKNNTSALAHSSFVEEAISELLSTNRIFESHVIPCNVNPLCVSVQSSGKRRLILDLSINTFGNRVFSLKTFR